MSLRRRMVAWGAGVGALIACGGGGTPARPQQDAEAEPPQDETPSDETETDAAAQESGGNTDEVMDAGTTSASGSTGPIVIQPGSSLDPTQSVATAPSPNVCVIENALQILFSPTYSAYDGVHSFKFPAVVAGIDPSRITWTTSDDSKVRHTRDDSFGGEMFETTGSGDVTIFASIGNVCGYTVLHITDATPELWQKGSDRYHNGAFVRRLGSITAPNSTDRTIDCTNCHGVKDSSTNSLGTVQHTPMQTGGFSDVDVKNIFLHGMTPTGMLAQPISNLTYDAWHSFHQWVVADDEEATGLVIYLRSLAPAPTGNADFGGAFGNTGRGNFDGGVFGPPRDGGAPRFDAGRSTPDGG